MTFGTVASVVGIAAGVKVLSSGGGQSSSDAQKAVDPFAPYRANLGKMYSGMLQPGAQTDITKMPGYSQFQTGVMDPALEASKRTSAASGMMRSGNEQIALQNTAQQGYSGFMTDYMNRLATGSGAGYAPAQGGMAGVNQGNLNQAAQMQALGGVLQGAGSLYKASGSGNTYGNPMQPVSDWSVGGGVNLNYDAGLAASQQANPMMAP
jgi:hypothetical protein